VLCVKDASLEDYCVRGCRSLANITQCPYVNSLFLNGCYIKAIDIIARIVPQYLLQPFGIQTGSRRA
jgi:hypothetical protein